LGNFSLSLGNFFTKTSGQPGFVLKYELKLNMLGMTLVAASLLDELSKQSRLSQVS
jgi:hypothetical protein